MVEHMLTTVDNPWHPFTQYKEWSSFDRAMGHNTAEKLATYIFTTNDLGEKVTLQDIEDGMQALVDADILGIYIKVTKDTVIKPITLEEYLAIL